MLTRVSLVTGFLGVCLSCNVAVHADSHEGDYNFDAVTVSLQQHTLLDTATPTLLQAVMHQDEEKLVELLSHPVSQVDKDTALHRTMYMRCQFDNKCSLKTTARMAQHLLQAGANPDADTAVAQDVIGAMIASGDIAMAKIIFTARPESINAPDVSGFTPLMHAVFGGFNPSPRYYPELSVEDITDKMRKEKVEGIRYAMIRILLSLGAKVNAENVPQTPSSLRTPLGVAVDSANDVATEMLLKSGADVNQPIDTLGTTPLMRATQIGNKDIISILLNNGANPHAKEKFGYTAHDIAPTDDMRAILAQAAK